MISKVGRRYAKALYSLAADTNRAEKVLNDLRVFVGIYNQSEDVKAYFCNPLTPAADLQEVLNKTFAKSPLHPETQQTLLLMAGKGRLPALPDLLAAYEEECDVANNLCRGQVRSASELGPADRLKVEQTVEKVLKKKVILNYKVDPSIIGGLVAQVGSFTFDDTISSHLSRINEDLKRRMV